jgi:hypothetical protein
MYDDPDVHIGEYVQIGMQQECNIACGAEGGGITGSCRRDFAFCGEELDGVASARVYESGMNQWIYGRPTCPNGANTMHDCTPEKLGGPLSCAPEMDNCQIYASKNGQGPHAQHNGECKFTVSFNKNNIYPCDIKRIEYNEYIVKSRYDEYCANQDSSKCEHYGDYYPVGALIYAECTDPARSSNGNYGIGFTCGADGNWLKDSQGCKANIPIPCKKNITIERYAHRDDNDGLHVSSRCSREAFVWPYQTTSFSCDGNTSCDRQDRVFAHCDFCTRVTGTSLYCNKNGNFSYVNPTASEWGCNGWGKGNQGWTLYQ